LAGEPQEVKKIFLLKKIFLNFFPLGFPSGFPLKNNFEIIAKKSQKSQKPNAGTPIGVPAAFRRTFSFISSFLDNTTYHSPCDRASTSQISLFS